MTKILHLTGNYPLPSTGGLEVAVLSIAQELGQAGSQVTVAGAAREAKEVQLNKVRLVGLPAWKLGNWVRWPRGRALRRLTRLIRESDVVHIHNPAETFCFLGALVTVSARRPLVLTLFSPGTLGRHPTQHFQLLGRLADRLVRILTTRAAFVQVKNQIDLAYVRSLTPRAALVPDGVPDDVFDTPKSGTAFLRDHGLAGGHPTLLYLGRLHPLKGVDRAVRVLRLLQKDYPDINLVVAGPDWDHFLPMVNLAAQEVGVTTRVRYVGSLDEGSKIEAIDACDVLVIPSVADFVEGFSIVASEAWARGKPVAAFPAGALKSRVKEGVNGSLADGFGELDLAKAITRSLRINHVVPPSDVVRWSSVARTLEGIYEEASIGNQISR
jgi:glycosyltransferase involved in cell wall biosynthesis